MVGSPESQVQRPKGVRVHASIVEPLGHRDCATAERLGSRELAQEVDRDGESRRSRA